MEVFLKFLPILLALTSFGVRMSEVATRRDVVKGPVQEKLTFQLFLLCGMIMIFGGIAEHVWQGFPRNWWLAGAGVLLAVSSILLRRATIAALGKFWSLHIEIRENHRFVQSGPFRFMRHPTYFSMILELLSIILILESYWLGLVAFIIFIPAMAKRISFEERAMVDKFGDEYRAYQKSTPVLLPIKLP